MRATPAADFTSDDIQIDDCWSRIGVRGDKTCPELPGHSHCRNCPTYSMAATALLDRDVAPPSTSGLTSPFSQLLPTEDVETESVLVFRVGTEWFALPTALLEEIVEIRTIHSLPHRRNPAVMGLVNVRGELVVCLSIAQLLVGEGTAAPQGRLVVARHANGQMAFPVDEVQHTHHHCPSELKPVPATIARSASSFTRGLLSWQGKTVGRLDEHLLFDALNRSMA